MKRRRFIQQAGILSASGLLLSNTWTNAAICTKDDYPELTKHKISKAELMELNYHWPRFVGKNGRIDFHGQQKKCTALKLYTDQGATGWGLSSKNAEAIFPQLIGQKVSDLIQPQVGIKDTLDKSVDFALHDLMGVILDKPIYQLLGNEGTKETPVYSGMIYLDELNPENKNKGFDAVLENCEWDYNYGYRQLKVKIGRSGRWYSHDEGLKKDIEIVKLIHDNFKDRSIDILVDSNDMYTLDDTIKFLDGIGDVPLFWVEEPFIENLNDGRAIRTWMDHNGFKNTYYVDGEANPNHEVCLQLGKEKIMDAFLPDIYGLGFSEWIRLQKKLKEINMLASPHAWGNRLKTNYIAHNAAAFGNIPTIEGVTCLSDDIDFGNYPITDGKLKVSEDPGFGMKIVK